MSDAIAEHAVQNPALHRGGGICGRSLRGFGLAPEFRDIAERILRPGRTDCTPNSVLPRAWFRLAGTGAGDLDGAEGHYTAALKLAEKSQSEDDQVGWYDVPAALIGLADARTGRGRFQEAEPLYMRALAIRQEAYGWESSGVAEALERHAASLQLAGRTADRNRLEWQAKSIRAKQGREKRGEINRSRTPSVDEPDGH